MGPMRRRVRDSRPSPGLLLAVLALVAALAGTAVAGPGASTSKITKKKVAAIADQEINRLAPGLSVAHARSADTATNADHALSANTADSADSATHATSADSATQATSAQSVGGVSIERVSIALAIGTETSLPLVSGAQVDLFCEDFSNQHVQFQIFRASSGPPISGQWIRNGVAPFVVHQAPDGATSPGGADVMWFAATVRESSGRVTRLTAEGFYEANAFGGPEDCFVQGTIERFG
jgi:hypothetical protein